MNSVRLKSSFIYLANAVNDLRGNWSLLAVVLAPLVLAAALCLLPDALNLQHRLATQFEPGSQNISFTHSISYTRADSVDSPSKTPPLQEWRPFSPWVTTTLHWILAILTLLVTLFTLSTLKRIHAGMREPTIIAEAIAIYRDLIKLTPGFIWIRFLQLAAPFAAFTLFQLSAIYQLDVVLYFALLVLIIVSALVYVWLYFAEYALILDGKHSFHALLYSRDLMRKQFFKVATRIVVFLAVWSGVNSWAAGAFVVVSLLVGPVGAVTGFLGSTIFLVDICEISVNFAATAFIVAAGMRLYQDLRERQVTAPELVESRVESAMQATAPLPSAARAL
ncbi:MAG TPA: hypothetical protein VGR40_11045 [Candidatus Binatus sp.]|nr:hypothetical protein [Candidatus Binatus sp.]